MALSNGVKMNLYRISTLITTIISFILGVITIYWLLLKVTGNSPTIDQIILIIVTIGGGALLKLVSDMGEVRGRLDEHIKHSDRRFDDLERKIESVSKDLKYLMKHNH